MATALVVPPVGDCYALNLPEQSANIVLNEHVGGHFETETE